MRRSMLIAAVACTAMMIGERPVAAQFAVAGKAGSTGVGGEVSIALGQRLSLRGSATVVPLKPTGTFDDIQYEVEPPSPMFTAGIDLNVTSGLRVFGGVLFGADELSLDGTYDQTVTFGSQTYNGSGTLTASVKTSATAPFAGLGFGRTVGRGVGLFLDVGAALLGKSDVTLNATGPITQAPDYEANRQLEEQNVQEDVDKYAKVYPMLNLGIRLGLR